MQGGRRKRKDKEKKEKPPKAPAADEAEVAVDLLDLRVGQIVKVLAFLACSSYSSNDQHACSYSWAVTRISFLSKKGVCYTQILCSSDKMKQGIARASH